jgi:hypothetical protein
MARSMAESPSRTFRPSARIAALPHAFFEKLTHTPDMAHTFRRIVSLWKTVYRTQTKNANLFAHMGEYLDKTLTFHPAITVDYLFECAILNYVKDSTTFYRGGTMDEI